MFNKIGSMIKTLAVVVLLGGIIVSVVSALLVWTTVGMSTMLGGCVEAVVAALLIYGFGELLEQTAAARQANEEILRVLRKNFDMAEEDQSEAIRRAASVGSYTIPGAKNGERAEDSWKCAKCGAENSRNAHFCKDCGEYK